MPMELHACFERLLTKASSKFTSKAEQKKAQHAKEQRQKQRKNKMAEKWRDLANQELLPFLRLCECVKFRVSGVHQCMS